MGVTLPVPGNTSIKQVVEEKILKSNLDIYIHSKFRKIRGALSPPPNDGRGRVFTPLSGGGMKSQAPGYGLPFSANTSPPRLI